MKGSDPGYFVLLRIEHLTYYWSCGSERYGEGDGTSISERDFTELIVANFRRFQIRGKPQLGRL